MGDQLFCDGCLANLEPREVEIEGKRRDMAGGGGLPSGDFHLCRTCAVVGFHAAATRKLAVDLHRLAGETNSAWRDRRKTS